ncbi:hypothetical protein G5C60_03445 [Streptomyces sp. HC44]|uniref:Uncharacterized protein n=1 Tax=Streptomyces scabichelini TaxID=2711217 RepID=A0A6G4UY88_9ACTN|nr:hypothetical protein [Streptomyces scabichelini]NGO06742.1 hypothetical protein [Streptomyces scabichelini]
MYETSERHTRTHSIADTFQYNPQMEAVERLQQDRPDQFDAMPADEKIQLGYYKAARAAAQELGRDVSGKDYL